MNEINYKNKYTELKNKFMSSVDAAYRLGYEQGMKDSDYNNMMQQQQQNAMGAVDENGNPIPGQEGQPGEGDPGMDENPNGDQPQEEMEMSQSPMGSELDQHIAKLESILHGSKDMPAETQLEMKKSLDYFKSVKANFDMQKSAKLIKNIGKSMKNFQLGKRATANLKEPAKKALTLQENIVSNIMKSWEAEEKKASKEISSILQIEGLLKKE